MKKFLAIITSALLLVGATMGLTACNDKEKLYVYTNAGFAPYEYVNEYGEVVGIDIDVMQEIGEILGYEVVINDIEFDNILNEVSKNKMAVGAAGMSKKEARDAVALASDIYATSQQYVIAPDNTFDANATVTVDQILAKVGTLKVGVQKGTTGADLVLGEDEVNADKVIEYSNAIVASEDIGTTLGAVVIDQLPAETISGNKNGLSCWKIDAEMESYVLYFNKEATELVKKVNNILAIMKTNGVIDYLTIKHSGGIVG